MDHNVKIASALVATPVMSALSLEECFGQLMNLNPETLRDLPGVPQQVMLAQTLYFMKTRTPIREELERITTLYDDVERIINIVGRTNVQQVRE